MIYPNFRRLAGLALVAVILGAPLAAAPALAQDAPAASPVAEAAADAAAPAAVTPAPEPAAPWAPDTGDTAWVLTSAVLVLMMTIPGLALFYGGMVRRKNVISTVAQSFAITCLVTVIWAVVGYSLAFGTNPDPNLNRFIGGLGNFMLANVKMDGANALAGTIPEYVFFMFQMTFAIITPALICGAFAERMKFSGPAASSRCLWSFLVYAPDRHIWCGAVASWAATGGARLRGRHRGAHQRRCRRPGLRPLPGQAERATATENMAPNNLVYTMIGASLLWVGWFGFNAGSAVASNALAGVAMANTQIATAVAGPGLDGGGVVRA